MNSFQRYRAVLRALNRYMTFFLLMGFVITCCMTLFVTTMSEVMNIELTEENVQAAAKITFLNVLLLAAVCTAIDGVRRRYTVEIPAKRILDAAQKIMQGDFSVRIPVGRSLYTEDHFAQISHCFNKMAEELSGTETLRTDFIANVSHELKTPLAVMRNYSTMLQQADLPEKDRQEYARHIADASGRLADLITNILKLNKLENQQIFPKTQEYDLGEQLCECLLAFEDAWEEKPLAIETDIEDDIFVNNDPEMMSLVWNNLFSNAIKFTDRGGTVKLTVYLEENAAVVQVQDNGCGISNEVGAHIFDKFYQGDTSHAKQGNGLGLALVKRVVDITGSEIFVKSELGRGSIFTVKMRGIKRGQA